MKKNHFILQINQRQRLIKWTTGQPEKILIKKIIKDRELN